MIRILANFQLHITLSGQEEHAEEQEDVRLAAGDAAEVQVGGHEGGGEGGGAAEEGAGGEDRGEDGEGEGGGQEGEAGSLLRAQGAEAGN